MNRNEYSVDLLRLNTATLQEREGLECFFVISGSMDIDLEGKAHHLSSDDIIVVNVNQRYAINGEPSALVLAFFAEREYMLKECPEMTRCTICCNSADDPAADSNRYAELKKNLIQLKLTDTENAEGSALNMRILVLRIFSILLTHFKTAQSDEGFQKDLENAPELSEVLYYLQKNYFAPISLKSMADIAFMSPHYFSKYFKKRVGESFYNYLQKIRMDHAIQSLCYGKDSILRIALDNGFANPKAFTNTFAQYYQETPSAYRKRFTETANSGSGQEGNKKDESADGSVTELLRRFRERDESKEQDKNRKEFLSVDLSGSYERFKRPQMNFLNIGRIDAALRSSFAQDLKDRYSLGLRYVYFNLPGMESGAKITKDLLATAWNYHIMQALEIFYMSGLIPVFRIDCEASEKQHESSCIRASVFTDKLLQIITGHFPKHYTEKWMFELHLGSIPLKQAMALYHEMHAVIKKNLPSSPVGLFSVSNDDGEGLEVFSQRLSQAVARQCRPDFVSFSVYPNILKADYMPDITHYPIAGYHKRVGTAVNDICGRLDCDDLPMYMIEWNTITGGNQTEINIYFRSALILQALMELNPIIDGAGFWYDTVDGYTMTNEHYAAALALYMFNSVRRPAHFVLETFTRLGEKVLWEAETAIATYRSDGAEWVVLAWNPSYLNPFYCASQRFLDWESKRVQLEITGLASGKYQFKKFSVNSNFSTTISQNISSGFPDHNDKDILDYLQQVVGKHLTVFEEELSGGTYLMSSDINMNGLFMLVIKKLG